MHIDAIGFLQQLYKWSQKAKHFYNCYLRRPKRWINVW